MIELTKSYNIARQRFCF